jgi:hypothetical protein
MNHFNPVKTGLALGKLFAGVHVIWAVLVAVGLGQTLINLFLWAHMVTTPITIGAFNFSAAAVLVVMSAFVGYVLGHSYAKLWNWLHHS